ncbi:hypothetical protein F4678DRAFT_79092 [Xylaria arbuscula]|nr:hypothetical protein F4678DRAFT_79092 [Xylaria arbuscula]
MPPLRTSNDVGILEAMSSSASLSLPPNSSLYVRVPVATCAKRATVMGRVPSVDVWLDRICHHGEPKMVSISYLGSVSWDKTMFQSSMGVAEKRVLSIFLAFLCLLASCVPVWLGISLCWSGSILFALSRSRFLSGTMSESFGEDLTASI